VEIGHHYQTVREPNESLREVELRRSPETRFESERNLKIQGQEVYQQVIPLISGGGKDSKKYGVYNIFELDGKLYFMELYTNNPNDYETFLEQMLLKISK
jgi:hypothetical protein